MKTLAWLFGIFVCASSAYGQKTVTIEGDIRNMPDTVRFFCAEMKGNGMDVRPEDQEIMVNGKFKFTRETDKTTKMYISLNNTGYTVWVKPGANIKIIGEAPYVQNWLAKSDIPIPEQVELNRFREATREENIRIHDLTAECMKLLPKIRAKDSVAKQEFASIRQTVNSIHDEIILQKELLLMLDYPITDAGLEKLRDAAKSCQAGKLKDKALVVSVYSKLTDEQRGGVRETFTVRKSSNGVGVEKTWPLHSPSVENVEVVRRGKVRRAKLNYLRSRIGKAAKVKELVK